MSMTELEPLHREGKASALRKFYCETDYSRLPEGAALLPSRELEGALTIHINMVKLPHDGPSVVWSRDLQERVHYVAESGMIKDTVA